MITVTITYDEAVKLAVDCLKDREAYYFDNGKRFEVAGHDAEASLNYARSKECAAAIGLIQAGRARY